MNTVRTKSVLIRMTESELEEMKKNVKKSGMNQQDYLVKAVTGKEIKNYDAFRELLPEVSKVGNNLNQIARSLNEKKYVDYTGTLANALKGCGDVWQLLSQYLLEQQ